jgi:Fe-S cluster assembly protein SufB
MANIGLFERSLIIADEGAQVHYVEDCTAPLYRTESFPQRRDEIVVKKGARVLTPHSELVHHVYKLVTQRGCEEDGLWNG